MQVAIRSRFMIFNLALLASVSLFGLMGCMPAPKPDKQQLLKQAELHLQQGNFHQALLELNQVLKEDPNNIKVHIDLAWIYLYTDQLDKAVGEMHQINALAQDQQTSEIFALKGAIYQKAEQWVDALEAYNEALKTDVNNPKLHEEVASVFLELNEPESALREYIVALKLDPDNSSYEFGRCMAYRQLKNYASAIGACESAIALSDSEQEKDQIQSVIETTKLLQTLQASAQ